MELSIGEILVVALVIIVLFGPDKLPQIARDLGQGVRKMRGAVEDIKTEILKETDNPVSEIKKEIEKVKEAALQASPVHSLKDDVFASDTKPETPEAPAPKPSEDENYQGPVSR